MSLDQPPLHHYREIHPHPTLLSDPPWKALDTRIPWLVTTTAEPVDDAAPSEPFSDLADLMRVERLSIS
jgi:hypothetical protein